jgi:hypothetical protein
VDALGGGKDLARGRHCLGLAEPRGGELGDFSAGLRDRPRHLQQVAAKALVGVPAAVAADHRLDALDGVEHEPGIGVAVAARIFLQEPAAARALHDGRADGVIVALRWQRGRNRG